MGFLIVMILTEILTPVVLRQHLSGTSRVKFYISLVIHVILSMWLWLLFVSIATDRGFFDNPRHIWMLMNFTGTFAAVVFPRVILILLHFTGNLVRIKSGDHVRWLTNMGLIIFAFFLSTIALGTLVGRFNFKSEHVTIKINGLNKDLDGIKIVQLSDMHLAGFYHHTKLLQEVMDVVNMYDPDLILNTGDFVSFGWREFDRNDTIIVKAKSRYGNFAVMGNHDFGTYHPDFTEADKDNNVLIMNSLLKASGYKVLNDENTIIKIGEAKIGLIGIITKGRYPDMLHGDLEKALAGLDSVDLKIFLSHDPNEWEEKVAGRTDIDITLSGHTHGMQMGIYTKKFKWSPSKYFYPHWSGLYKEGDQYQYVNRGLGVLAIPFRLCMPPEITIITLRAS
jgi:uncharacterized protein